MIEFVELEGLVDPRKEADAGRLIMYATVQEGLIDAMLLWRRAPDREHGWQAVRSFWPEIKRHGHFGDGDGEINHSDEKSQPRPLPLTRAEVAEMNRVGEWLRFVPEEDRRLVVMAVQQLANGRKRVKWLKLRQAMGVQLGADALRKRYGAAITAICAALNAQKTAENCTGTCQP